MGKRRGFSEDEQAVAYAIVDRTIARCRPVVTAARYAQMREALVDQLLTTTEGRERLARERARHAE